MNLSLGCSRSVVHHNSRGRGRKKNYNGKRNNQKILFSNKACSKCWRLFTNFELNPANQLVIVIKTGPVHWGCIMPEYMQQLRQVGISLSQYSTPRLFQRSLIETTKKALHRPFNEAENQLSVIQLVAQEFGQPIDLSKLIARQSQVA